MVPLDKLSMRPFRAVSGSVHMAREQEKSQSLHQQIKKSAVCAVSEALDRHTKLGEKAVYMDREGKVRTLPEPAKTPG